MAFDEETMKGKIIITARCNKDPRGRGWTVDVGDVIRRYKALDEALYSDNEGGEDE